MPGDFFGTVCKTLRLTTAYCAPSRSELITNLHNRLVHHLISTKLCCTKVYVGDRITLWTLHVCCQLQKHYTMHPCPCARPVGGNPTSHNPTSHRYRSPLVHHGAQCRSVVHNIVLYPRSGAQRRSHKTNRGKETHEKLTLESWYFTYSPICKKYYM